MKTPRLLLLGAACALMALAGCASPGAPQPPSLNLPKQVNDLTAVRKGDRVVLTWAPPSSTTDRGPIRHAGVTRICRVVNQFPMASCEYVVKELRPSDLPSASPEARTPRVVFEDVLPARLLAASAQATYAVEVLNPRGRSAGLSNQVIVPLAASLAPPAEVQGVVGAQGVTITWSAVAPAPTPAGISYRYTLWRRAQGTNEYSEIERVPLNGERSVQDPSFEWEHIYEYKVSAITVIAQPGHAPLEVAGDDSPVIRVYAHDTFPPERPSGLQAVFSSVGQKPFVDLSWEPNMEADLAGYDVYRRAPGEAEHKLNRELLKAPSFRDENVAAGTTYTYSVEAVDARGNRSPRSDNSTESIPK